MRWYKVTVGQSFMSNNVTALQRENGLFTGSSDQKRVRLAEAFVKQKKMQRRSISSSKFIITAVRNFSSLTDKLVNYIFRRICVQN